MRQDELKQITKNEEQALKEDQKIEKELDSKLSSCKDKSEEKEALVQAKKDHEAKKKERVQNYIVNQQANAIRLEPIGLDRFYNRYWLMNVLVETSGWLLVEHASSGQWGYYSDPSEVKMLIYSLDPRGCRENELCRNLRAQKSHIVSTMLRVRNEAIELVQKYRNITQRTPESIARMEAEINEKILSTEKLLEAARVSADDWGEAHAEDGKVYYYHKETRETTWDLPEPKGKVQTIEAELTKLQEKKGHVHEGSSDEEETTIKYDLVDDAVLSVLAKQTVATEMEQFKVPRESKSVNESNDNAKVASKQMLEQDVIQIQFEKSISLGVLYRTVELFSLLLTVEQQTIGPSVNIIYSPKQEKWLRGGRDDWLDQIENIVGETSKFRGKAYNPDSTSDGEEDETPLKALVGKDRGKLVGKLISDTKDAMRRLYRQYVGSPYNVDHVKAQEAVVRAVRHEFRWNRALDRATTFSQLGLLEAQLRHILGIKSDAKFNRAAKSTYTILIKAQQIPIY